MAQINVQQVWTIVATNADEWALVLLWWESRKTAPDFALATFDQNDAAFTLTVTLFSPYQELNWTPPTYP